MTHVFSTAICASSALVLLASPHGLGSTWVMREVSAAQTSGVPVIPMLTSGARFGDLPAHLAGVNGVDLQEDYSEAVAKVVFAITRQQLGVGRREDASEYDGRALLLLTVDEKLAAEVNTVCRSVGLHVVHHVVEPQSLPAEIMRAHVVLVDDDARWDMSFVAGCTVGAGRWGICLLRGRKVRLPAVTGLAFVAHGSARLEAEICAAAFLTVRHSAAR